MTRRILVLAAPLFPFRADARKRKKRKRKVVSIIDQTSATWDGVLAKTVADFNAVMPPTGPVLRYVRSDPVVCAADVVACSGPVPPPIGGLARTFAPGRASIIFSDTLPLTPEQRSYAACHEMMHALTGIGDSPDERNDSCVWGRLTGPGSWDIALLWETYRR